MFMRRFNHGFPVVPAAIFVDTIYVDEEYSQAPFGLSIRRSPNGELVDGGFALVINELMYRVGFVLGAITIVIA
jgi:hypothetical protein